MMGKLIEESLGIEVVGVLEYARQQFGKICRFGINWFCVVRGLSINGITATADALKRELGSKGAGKMFCRIVQDVGRIAVEFRCKFTTIEDKR